MDKGLIVFLCACVLITFFILPQVWFQSLEDSLDLFWNNFDLWLQENALKSKYIGFALFVVCPLIVVVVLCLTRREDAV